MRTLLLLLVLPRTETVPAEIARLDEVIQRRFESRTAFGFSRILPRRHEGIMSFATENDAERIVVASLAKYQVAMYLTGRSGLQGPALITPVSAALPDREALVSLKEEQASEGKLGNWNVALRPIRAREACVGCHPFAQVSGALGVATYLYMAR